MAGPLLLGVVDDLVGVTLLHDEAAVHKDDLVRHVPGEGHCMGDDDHGGLLLRQVADDPQHFSRQLRVQGGGGLVKAQNVRMQRQSPGNGHPLLLAAGELVGIVARPVGKTHLGQQLPSGGLNVRLTLAATLLCQQLPGQCDVLQGRVLGEQVEVLEHKAEVEALGADLLFLLGGRVRSVKNHIVVDGNGSTIRCFQKVQTPQQRGFAAAGGPDDGEGLPLFQGKADVIEYFGGAEMLFDVVDFQNRHMAPP